MRKDTRFFVATIISISVPVFFAHAVYEEQDALLTSVEAAREATVDEQDIWTLRRSAQLRKEDDLSLAQQRRLSGIADRVVEVAAKEAAAREAERQRRLAAQAAARAAERQRVLAAQAAAAQKAAKKAKKKKSKKSRAS